MTLVPGKQEQLRLVGWLRWRLFVNSLRTGRGKADLASKVVLSLGIVAAVLGSGRSWAWEVGTRSATANPSSFRPRSGRYFLVWLLVPLLITGFGAESDPASLLRFPLRYSTFVLLALHMGSSTPWPWLPCTGSWRCSPASPSRRQARCCGRFRVWLRFALFNLLLNRVDFRLAQPVDGPAADAGNPGCALHPRDVQLSTDRAFDRALRETCAHPVFTRLRRRRPPPAARHGRHYNHGGARRPCAGRAEFAGLLAYCGVLGWAALPSLAGGVPRRKPERGPPAGDRKAFHRARRLERGRALPDGGGSAEKDLRYLVRNTTAYFTLLAPLYRHRYELWAMAGLAQGNRSSCASSSFFFPMSVGYVMLILVGLAYNNLGYDGPGLPMLLAAPIRFRDVLVAKNLLHTPGGLGEVFAVSALGWFLVGPTPPLVVAVTLAGALWSS